MDNAILRKAFKCLDDIIHRPLKIVIVGGGAMLLAHRMPLVTYDIDAAPFKSDWSLAELDQKVKQVAHLIKLHPDWLNPYFTSFSYVLPKDYDLRLILVYEGKKLKAYALGAEDLLILKCFAGRAKDVGHAKWLMKKLKNLSFIEMHLEKMLEQNIPKAQEALDFFDEIKSLIKG